MRAPVSSCHSFLLADFASPLIHGVRHVFGQACKLAGRQDAVAQELLPQLLPMFSIPSEQRAAYGSSVPLSAAGAQAGGAARGPEQSGYWDLIYILYPELLENVGSAVVRELVPTWPLVERTLEVRTCGVGFGIVPALYIRDGRRSHRLLS